jgi:hypothetical protein
MNEFNEKIKKLKEDNELSKNNIKKVAIEYAI